MTQTVLVLSIFWLIAVFCVGSAALVLSYERGRALRRGEQNEQGGAAYRPGVTAFSVGVIAIGVFFFLLGGGVWLVATFTPA